MADRARVVAPVLVGRERELELLAAAVASPPAVVTIEGEAGIGKTRLVRELASSPALADRRWLIGSCRRIHEPFPLGPVLEALRGAAEDLRGLSLSPVAGALRPLLPELADVLPDELAPLGDGPAERHRIFRALAELLAALGPAVLVLEDMHWADEQTLELLAYLTPELAADLALVLTFRGEEVAPTARAAVAKLPPSVARQELRLEPFDAPQTAELAAAILDAPHISEAFAEHLRAKASGLPFAIEELLALLRSRGTLVHSPGGWARRELDELDVPSGIRDPVLERIGRLSAHARSLIEAAAVIDVPAPASVMVSVARVPRADAAAAVDEAVGSGLLAEDGETVGFRHVLAAQAVYEAIPAQRRGQVHGRAASALKRLGPAPLGQLAHHLKRAGRMTEWMRAAEAAADAAAAVGNDAEAVRLLEEVLKGAPLDAEQRWRLALKLGEVCGLSGAARTDVAESLAAVLDDPMPRAARAELRFWLAIVLQNAGEDRVRMRGLLLEAIDDLDERPDLTAWVAVNLGIPMPPAVPVSEHQRWLQRALDTLPSVGDRDLEALLLGVIAMSMAQLGDPQWRALTSELVARTAAGPRTRWEASAYLRVAMAACYIGEHGQAASLLAAVEEAQGSDMHPRTLREVASVSTLLDVCRGHWQGLATRAASLLEDLDPAQGLDVEVVAGHLALAAGELGDARRLLSEATVKLERWGESWMLAFAIAAIARDGLASGDVEQALEISDRFVLGLEDKEMWAPLSRALPAITGLWLACARQVRVREIVDCYAGALGKLDAPLGSAALAHARGLLYCAEGRTANASREFIAASEEYERHSGPYEAAQAREQAAAALFQVDVAAAERELRTALSTYQTLGAAWDEARCLRLGRAHGVRLAATHRRGRKGYGEALSPREQEVTRLAAAGLTNKEISAELYLSPNTVNKHLGRAMRKLGVRSRAAIGTRLAEERDSTDPMGEP